jgi:hypothetical protein
VRSQEPFSEHDRRRSPGAQGGFVRRGVDPPCAAADDGEAGSLSGLVRMVIAIGAGHRVLAFTWVSSSSVAAFRNRLSPVDLDAREGVRKMAPESWARTRARARLHAGGPPPASDGSLP